jgi:hypothetical protein
MPDDRSPNPDLARLGLQAAAAAVERMLELGRSAASGLRVPLAPNGEPPVGNGFTGAPPDEPPAPDAPDLAALSRRLRADSERLVELYASWTRALVDGAASLVEQASGLPTAHGGAGHETLILGPAAAGTTTSASAWLHVLDGPPAPTSALHATDLVAHDGSCVPGAAVTCAPPSLETDSTRTTTEVTVSARVPPGAGPGVYHGHLLASGLPEVALALRLEVVA